MSGAQMTKALSRSDIPVFLAAATDHRRKSEAATNLLDRAAHAAIARKWESRAAGAQWGR